MDIFDYVDDEQKDYKLNEYVKSTKLRNDSIIVYKDRFLKNILRPTKHLLGIFNKINFLDVYGKSMNEIYRMIKDFANCNIILITEWTFYHGRTDEVEFNKNPHGRVIPAFPNKKMDNREKPYHTYFYKLNDESFQSEEELNEFLEYWFRSFDSYSGYIVDKKKVADFEKYVILEKESELLKDAFRKSIRGFFSSVHDFDTLILLENK